MILYWKALIPSVSSVFTKTTLRPFFLFLKRVEAAAAAAAAVVVVVVVVVLLLL